MTDLQIIKQIEEELNIRFGKVEKITWLTNSYTVNKQAKITGLGLYRCQIEDLSRIIDFLRALKNLTVLNLGANKISDYSVLKKIKNLTSLDLRNSKISDISFLKDLKNLTSLDLSENKFSNISFLKDLKNLTSLNLSDNKLSDISILKELIKLTSLYLRGFYRTV